MAWLVCRLAATPAPVPMTAPDVTKAIRTHGSSPVIARPTNAVARLTQVRTSTRPRTCSNDLPDQRSTLMMRNPPPIPRPPVSNPMIKNRPLVCQARRWPGCSLDFQTTLLAIMTQPRVVTKANSKCSVRTPKRLKARLLASDPTAMDTPSINESPRSTSPRTPYAAPLRAVARNPCTTTREVTKWASSGTDIKSGMTKKKRAREKMSPPAPSTAATNDEQAATPSAHSPKVTIVSARRDGCSMGVLSLLAPTPSRLRCGDLEYSAYPLSLRVRQWHLLTSPWFAVGRDGYGASRSCSPRAKSASTASWERLTRWSNSSRNLRTSSLLRLRSSATGRSNRRPRWDR